MTSDYLAKRLVESKTVKILIPLTALILAALSASGETLDKTMDRFLAGETITKEDVESIPDLYADSQDFPDKPNARRYFRQLRRSILDHPYNQIWAYKTPLLYDSKNRDKTYAEVKAVYEKDKTPFHACALVCPAMYVEDFGILPELIAKISENKPLKAHFDKVYESLWKNYLDPDF